MNVLVTGGAGCIGSDLCELLLRRGNEVLAVDNLSSGSVDHLEGVLDHPRFRFVEGDLLDPAVLCQVMPGVEFVYHMAANPDVKYTHGERTDKDLRQNTLVTYNVLEAMRVAGIRNLAFSSTSAVYGSHAVQPIPEAAATRPISLYGATKLACEALISAFQHLFDMRCWIFRFANIVGPKMRTRGRTVIADFILRLFANPKRLEVLGNGRQAKSYMLASECVDAMLYLVENTRGDFHVYNLGCDDWLSVSRIAEMVIGAMDLHDVEIFYGSTDAGWPGDVPRFRLDVTALNRIGWKAKRTSEEAVFEAIQSTLSAVKQGGLPAMPCNPSF